MNKGDARIFDGLVAAGVGLALMAIPMTAVAQESPIEWKFFTYFAPNDKPTQLNRAFAEDVASATDGRLHITVFAGGELPYKAPDVVRAVATNQVQMGDVAVGFAAGDVPELNVLSMPFLCTSYKDFNRAIPKIAPIVSGVMKKRYGLETGVQWTMPPQNLWLNRPVSSLDDIQGLKVRTWNPQQVKMIELLGGSPVSITSAEVIPALERGTIDGAITSALSANDWRAYDTIKTGYMVNMTMGHQMMLLNGEQLEALPDDVEKILRAKIDEWAPKYNNMSEEGDVAARDNLRANGVTLVEPSAEDMQQARKLLRPLWSDWAKAHGDVGSQLLETAESVCAS
jgi:TRAP-type C4-dicarboxylate transport system substrate-binding protein